MSDTPTASRLRSRREIFGISQGALAELAGLTRQTVNAIEAGRSTPSVEVAFRLAAALDSSVEALFGTATADRTLDTLRASDTHAERVGLAKIRGRWVSIPLIGDLVHRAADALVSSHTPTRAKVTPSGPLTEARENLVVSGCAVALGLLADRLGQHRGPRTLWLPTSSMAALSALKAGLTHVAGVHLDDTGEANIAEARKAASNESFTLVTLARWQQGLVVRQDDPRITSMTDLARPELRRIARQDGSGAQRVFLAALASAGLPARLRRTPTLVAPGHLDVARAVAAGVGDVGVTSHDVAMAFGLRFIPLSTERYDLVVAKAMLTDPRIERLFDLLTAKTTRDELTSLGYDVAEAGRQVAHVRAA